MISAPTVTLVDVWESFLTIRVEQPRAVGSEGRPSKWEVAVLSGERILRNLMVAATALVETIHIDRGLEQVRSIVIEVRGIGVETGDHGQVAKLPVELLPRPSLSQSAILPAQLDLHWVFEGFQSPVGPLVSTVQVGISLDEFTHKDGEYLVDTPCSHRDSHLEGSLQVHLPPHLVQSEPNFCVFARVRCRSMTTGDWGSWSSKRRMFCFSPLEVSIESVSSKGILVVWGRTDGPEHQTGRSLVREDDAALSRFEVSVWQATPKSAPFPESPRPVPHTVSTDQARIFGLNTTEVGELLPSSVYNVCARWLQSCGGGWHYKYFRITTQAEPRIVALPRIGSSTVEVAWTIDAPALTTDLQDYHDEELHPGMPHTPNYHILPPTEIAKRTACDLHRLTVWSCGDVIKAVDVQHQSAMDIQRAVIEGLPSGTPMRVWVTSALKYVDPISRVPLWSWGKSSAPKIVVTVSDVRVVPQHRGPNFIVLTLGCDPQEPVRVLESDFFTATDNSIPPSTFVTPVVGKYTLRRVDKFAPSSSNLLPVASGELDLRCQSVLQLDGLLPSSEYVLSVDVVDADGQDCTPQHITLSTIAEDLLYTRPYTRPSAAQGICIDQEFHDKHQPTCGNTEVRYLTEVGEVRQKELAAIVAMGPSRVDSISLRSAVVSLGSDHAVLEWCAFSTKPLEGNANGVSIFAESSKQHAIAFNTTERAVREYRMRISMSPLTSTVIEHGRPIAETTKEIYFRSAVRLTKLVGLQEGYKYRVVMSYFNVGSQKWSPWSPPLLFRPADRLIIHSPLISPTCITIHWKRNTAVDIDNVGEMPMQHVTYELQVTHSTGERIVKTNLVETSFSYRNVLPGTIQFRVKPCFEDGSCGPYSPSFCVAVCPLKLLCSQVSQTSASLEWTLPANLSFFEHRRGVIAIRVAAEGPLNIRSEELPPYIEHTLLDHLQPSTEYTVSATYLVEVLPLSAEARFDDADPMTFITLDPVPLSVETVGEDFAIVRWRRVELEPSSLPPEQRASIVSFASPLRSPLTSANASKANEQYEVSVYDSDFGHINTEVATVSRLSGLVMQRKVKNLLPGCVYRVSVRLMGIGGCKPLEILFRTCGRLEILPTLDGGCWKCAFKREMTAVDPNPLKHQSLSDGPAVHRLTAPVQLAFPIEVVVEEVPDAPLPLTTGDRAAIAHAGLKRVRCFKRVFTTSMAEAAIFKGIPTHIRQLRFRARQQSISGEWLPWTQLIVQTYAAAADL